MPLFVPMSLSPPYGGYGWTGMDSYAEAVQRGQERASTRDPTPNHQRLLQESTGVGTTHHADSERIWVPGDSGHGVGLSRTRVAALKQRPELHTAVEGGRRR